MYAHLTHPTTNWSTVQLYQVYLLQSSVSSTVQKNINNHISCCVGTLMRGQEFLIIHYKNVRRGGHMNLSSYVGTDSHRIK